MRGAKNATTPPLMTFSRVYFRNHMLSGAPTGSNGEANPSGWMTTEIFETWLDHFISHSHSSEDSHTLLIMDTINCIFRLNH